VRSPSGLILLAFLAIAAFFLITEPWLHVHSRHGRTGHAAHQPRSPQGGE
jgi:hypothetical protein